MNKLKCMLDHHQLIQFVSLTNLHNLDTIEVYYQRHHSSLLNLLAKRSQRNCIKVHQLNKYQFQWNKHNFMPPAPRRREYATQPIFSH